MKKSWKGILLVSLGIVLVPWYLGDFEFVGMGYWVQAALALVLGAVIVSPLVNLAERRLGGGLAALVALMVLPETVLFFHFILFPRITALLTM
ncbi:MAG: hypothetical protein HN673_17475 [Rhodospirillales bacterium]|jgi:hypothetical protein|nr:hypothetical protein [Rhodospirillales bacterium]